MFNSHCHTLFSPDSQVDPRIYNDLAHETNTYFIVTDHIDFDSNTIIDLDCYTRALKDATLDRALIGVELGMNLAYVEEMNRVYHDERLDFILGSIHSIEGRDAATLLRLSQHPRPIILAYYQHMLNIISSYDGYDVLGHIDYPMRYTSSPFY